jgi:RNA 3'-terminal phosphate cyclase-like protein
MCQSHHTYGYHIRDCRAMQKRAPLEFEGSSSFRHHLVCSLLKNQPVTIRGINAHADRPGLRDFEVNFMKFIDRVSAGSSFEVRDSNSEVTFSPGLILGGVFAHAVPSSRSVIYIAEAALLLLPFAKHASEITFTGCTQSDLDMSPDTIRTVTLRWLRLFGVDAQLRIVRRGAAPDGNGCVILTVANVRRLRAASAIERGKIRRVRGICFSSNVAPDLPKQAATAAKGLLLNLLPDIYVVTDNFVSPPGHRTAGTNGYGLLLVAESTAATCVLSQETVAAADDKPTDVGTRAAERLLDEVSLGGCVDAQHQQLVLMLMALAPDEVSTVRFGNLTESAVTTMTLVEAFFGVTCAIKRDVDLIHDFGESIVVSCIGSNCINVAKKSG